MIRELTIRTPEGAEVISGNRSTRRHWTAQHRRASAQRKLIVPALLDAWKRAPIRPTLPSGEANVFRVTMTRITIHGRGLDEHENLRQGFKSYVDGLAAVIFRWDQARCALDDPKAWKRIAGRDDGRKGLSWYYDEQRSTDLEGIRVRVEDLDEGDDVIVYQDTPRVLGVSARTSESGRPEKPKPIEKAPQQQMLFRRAWLALPWMQSDPNAEEFEHLVAADHLSRLLDAPAHIEVNSPRRERVRLYRHDHFDPALGGRIWLYCDIKPEEQNR